MERSHPRFVASVLRDPSVGAHEGAPLLGCLDIQVWLTAFAYMGIIVSLYSYSLFRSVPLSQKGVLSSKLRFTMILSAQPSSMA